ncbi:MAG: hypothetical protein HY672_04065 [Chloroflexi bacterium]|nr:hypothetical protein [Chloroflexota bacterium]
MALRLAGEEFSVLQGLDELGWLRSIEVSDGAPGLKVKQNGSGPLFEFYDGAVKVLYANSGGSVALGRDISLGGNKLKTTDLELKQDSSDRMGVWGTIPGVYRDFIARNLIVYATGLSVGLRLLTESSTDLAIYDEGGSARRSLSLDSLSFFGALASQTTDGGLQAKNADGAN